MTPRSDSRETIRSAVERARTALRRLPSAGRGTARTRARVTDGLTCQIEDGAWHLTVDMPEKAGGAGTGPDPGVLGRGALASCLAVGYSMWAAHRGVTFDSLEVEVRTEYDARPEYGVGEGTPGYEAIDWIVRVQSSAPVEDVMEVLATAERRSPWLALLGNAQELRREVRLNDDGEA